MRWSIFLVWVVGVAIVLGFTWFSSEQAPNSQAGAFFCIVIGKESKTEVEQNVRLLERLSMLEV